MLAADNKQPDSSDLQQKYQRLRAALEHSMSGTLVVGRDGTIHFVNTQWASLYGLSQDQLLGMNVSDLYDNHDAYRENWEAKIIEAQEKGKYEGVLAHRRRDGKRLSLWVRITPNETVGAGESGSFVVSGMDITEQKKSEELLKVVSGVAGQFLSSQNWEEVIQEVLGILGQAVSVSRVYIFEDFQEGEKIFGRQRYEWVAEGISAQINNPELQRVEYREVGFGRWMDEFAQGNVVYGKVSEFPESEQEFLLAQDIKSLVVVPIFVVKQLWGFIGFDDCVTERYWKSDEVESLKIVAQILGSAIERTGADSVLQKAYRDVEKKNEELEKLNKVMVGREMKMMELKRELGQRDVGTSEIIPENNSNIDPIERTNAQNNTSS